MSAAAVSLLVLGSLVLIVRAICPRQQLREASRELHVDGTRLPILYPTARRSTPQQGTLRC